MSYEAKGQCDSQTDGGINARHPIVRHDAPPAMQFFEAANGEWLPDIKGTKKYKTREQVVPVEQAQREKEEVNPAAGQVGELREMRGNPEGHEAEEQRQMDAGNFVNDDVSRIGDPGKLGSARGAPGPDYCEEEKHENRWNEKDPC